MGDCSQGLRFASVELEVLRLLGRGAFGEVLLARASPSGGESSLVAVKKVPVGQISDAGVEKACEEARLLQRLGKEHASILRCFDYRVLPGPSPALELMLEFATLGDLSAVIRDRRASQRPQDDEAGALATASPKGLPEAEVATYGRDMAAGLAHLHAQRPKILHRDVKPANVVLFLSADAEGEGQRLPRAKLADFGIAKILETEGSFAGAATVVGTPHYFSPEMCRGEQYDERADAWALGCVLYEMVCLHRPFHKAEGNLGVLAIRVSEGGYDKEALARQAAGYNGVVLLTTAYLLAGQPEQRYRASDALGALQQLAASAGEAPVAPDCWWLQRSADAEASMSAPGIAASGPATPAAASTTGDSWKGATFLDDVDAPATMLPSWKLPTPSSACPRPDSATLPPARPESAPRVWTPAAQAHTATFGLSSGLLAATEASEPATAKPPAEEAEQSMSCESELTAAAAPKCDETPSSVAGPQGAGMESTALPQGQPGSFGPASAGAAWGLDSTITCFDLGEQPARGGAAAGGPAAAARLAWGGAAPVEPATPASAAEVPGATPPAAAAARDGDPGGAAPRPQSALATRLFVRPLWRGGGRGPTGGSMPPMVFCFAHGEGDTLPSGSVERGPSEQNSDWQEVQLPCRPPASGAAAAGAAGKDDSIFALTSLE